MVVTRWSCSVAIFSMRRGDTERLDLEPQLAVDLFLGGALTLHALASR